MPQPQDNARVFLVVILIFWLIATPDTGPAGLISVPALTNARLARQRAAHAVLNSTRWGDFSPRVVGDALGTAPRYLNLTGFREEDGYAWDDLDRFRGRCLEWSRHAKPSSAGTKDVSDAGGVEPIWQNATGIVNGEWVRQEASVRRYAAGYNLSEITPSINWFGTHSDWSRNITGSQGKILMRVDDKEKDYTFAEVKEDGPPQAGVTVREVSALVTLGDDWGSGSTWDMRLHGVHWPRQGAMLLTTTSEKFAGIFGLPHLTPGPLFFGSSQTMLDQTLGEVLRKKEKTTFSDPSDPWSSSADGPGGENWNPFPHCEHLLYVQIHPVVSQSGGFAEHGDGAKEKQVTLVKEIESELRFPVGAPIPEIPELQMSAVLWSPDCAYFLETKGPPHYLSVEGQHLVGMKQEVFIYEAKIWLLAFAAVLFAQIHLLKTQMKDSSTPSTMARVSFYTASAMLMADGLVFAGSSAWALSASTTFLPALLVTFAAFLSMTIGGAFLAEIYKVQEPERRNRDRDQPQAPGNGSGTTPANTTLAGDSLPRPVTAAQIQGTATPPIIIPSDQDIDAEIAENAGNAGSAVPGAAATAVAGANTIGQQIRNTTFSSIAGRFVLLGTCILFISLAATSWPASIRNIYVNMLAFLYLSLWVPQILRNIQRNSRRAFSWRFMIGQSVLRSLPFAYFYLREDNIVFADPDWYGFGALAVWLWVQLWVLAFQDVLGPRFGIPKSWTPEAWDYHPVLREDSLEAGGLPIGLVSASAPGSPAVDRVRSLSLGGGDHGAEGSDRAKEKEKEQNKDKKRTHMRSIECAICQEILEVPVVKAGEDEPAAIGGVTGVFARRLYMVTPCRHIFHSACLEGWLRFRLQCPICREELPPL